MCLLHYWVAMSAMLTTEDTPLLLLRALASAGMCLPSHCLAMNYSGSQASCRNIKIYVICFANTVLPAGIKHSIRQEKS
jgi:Na+-transporting NADH:ubiquinone oxidoreductase subunit NqrF